MLKITEIMAKTRGLIISGDINGFKKLKINTDKQIWDDIESKLIGFWGIYALLSGNIKVIDFAIGNDWLNKINKNEIKKFDIVDVIIVNELSYLKKIINTKNTAITPVLKQLCLNAIKEKRYDIVNLILNNVVFINNDMIYYKKNNDSQIKNLIHLGMLSFFIKDNDFFVDYCKSLKLNNKIKTDVLFAIYQICRDEKPLKSWLSLENEWNNPLWIKTIKNNIKFLIEASNVKDVNYFLKKICYMTDKIDNDDLLMYVVGIKNIENIGYIVNKIEVNDKNNAIIFNSGNASDEFKDVWNKKILNNKLKEKLILNNNHNKVIKV